MSDFGSGPFLTEDFDFEVTTTGDIRISKGVKELEKDIAFQNVIELQNVAGSRKTPQIRARLRSRVQAILLQDPRISSVNSIEIIFVDGNETAKIVTSVIADDSEQELVFEVS